MFDSFSPDNLFKPFKNDTMKAQIFLAGLESDGLQSIEVITVDSIDQVKERLYALQLGYCENEKPKFRIADTWTSNKGNKLQSLECYSASDFSYLAVYKVSL